MKHKYNFYDFLNGKIVLKANVCHTHIISLKLQEYEINTAVIDEMVRIDDPVIYMLIDNSDLTLLYPGATVNQDITPIVDFDDIDSCEWNLSRYEFKLRQVVHVVLDVRSREPFNMFANKEHITAYISCIDLENKMCEVVYLHNTHKSIWVSFDEVYPIFNIYESEDYEYDIYKEEGDEDD